MNEVMLWGPPVVDSAPTAQEYRAEIEAWVRRCADSGVTRIIISGGWTPIFAEAAHAHGIEVHPYVNYNSFPRHGRARVIYGWSLNFLPEPIDSPEARALMDAHRPIWDDPKVTTTMTDFARMHPEYRSLTLDRSYTLHPGEDLYLSLAFPEVRAEQTRQFVEVLETTDGSGVQVEFVEGNEDGLGVVTYGYEDAVADAFEQEHGKSPFDIPNDDPDWMQFRADYVTRYLVELRGGVKNIPSNTPASTQAGQSCSNLR